MARVENKDALSIKVKITAADDWAPQIFRVSGDMLMS